MLEGRVLGDRYRLIAPLNQGGMGSVWRAEHVALRMPVVVKLMAEEISEDGDARSRFEREAKAVAALRSPYVVQIMDYGVDGGTPYITMELLEGDSLGQRLRRDVMLPLSEVAMVVSHVAKALDVAHGLGIVHRDLKPDNIFLARVHDGLLAKLLDFGIAKAVDPFLLAARKATITGAILGTPQYMSPEQVSGRRAVDYRTDIWALGVVVCECLTGAVPFSGRTLGELSLSICADPLPIPSERGTVPVGFDAWFARCVNRNPDERYRSIRTAAQAFAELCCAAEASVSAVGPVRHLGHQGRRSADGGSVSEGGAPHTLLDKDASIVVVQPDAHGSTPESLMLMRATERQVGSPMTRQQDANDDCPVSEGHRERRSAAVALGEHSGSVASTAPLSSVVQHASRVRGRPLRPAIGVAVLVLGTAGVLIGASRRGPVVASVPPLAGSAAMMRASTPQSTATLLLRGSSDEASRPTEQGQSIGRDAVETPIVSTAFLVAPALSAASELALSTPSPSARPGWPNPPLGAPPASVSATPSAMRTVAAPSADSESAADPAPKASGSHRDPLRRGAPPIRASAHGSSVVKRNQVSDAMRERLAF